jgi:prepilin-type N-terminal cleavage/methylation domain-containing protein
MKSDSQNGFTLLELLIIIAIVAVIGVVSFSYSFGSRRGQALRSATRSVVAVLRDTQTRAVGQEAGVSWGVRFSNPSGGGFDQYEVFTGAVYDADTVMQVYSFRSTGVAFSSPASGAVTDVVFSPLSGRVTSPVFVVLTISGESATGEVSVNALGQVSGEVVGN